jgi:Transcriptional regulator containing PAS, AAA-type ATPase, and DNA-binding domains
LFNCIEGIQKNDGINKQVRKEILESWERCEKRSLPKNLNMVSTPTEYNDYFKISKGFLRLTQEFTSCFYQNMETNNEVQFYAYDNGIIFAQYGHQEVIKYFNSLNIGIGTCIFEEYLGTTAATLIKQTNEEAWVVGNEHYLDILSPYATYCSFSEDLHIYTLIILPKKKFGVGFLNATNMFHKTMKATIQSYRKEIELNMKVELFDDLLDNKNQAVLFIDSLGKVITANRTFCSWFALGHDKIQNIHCLSIFPELKIALNYMQIGERKVFDKIYLEKAPINKQYMRMDITPVTNNQEVSGLIITLFDTNTFYLKTDKTGNVSVNYTFDSILGKSFGMLKAKKQAIIAAHSNSSIVITGESGTGKELFAQSIHNESLRRDKPFVAVNCAGLPEELITSELFGYVEGAFTGAKKGGNIGKFEYANGGTIFLDEIGELPLSAQAILLRVLEERSVTKIGSNVAVPINIRLICATNRDLKKMVKEGKFRLDLFYRINVMHLYLPPLREQITDIPMFANYYIQYFNDLLSKHIEEVSQEALAFLIRYDWPGNFREFRNVFECAMNNVHGFILNIDNFPDDLFDNSSDIAEDGTGETYMQNNDFYSEERKRIMRLMIEYSGNKSQVAEELGISRSTLYKKIKEYKIV